MTAPQPRSPRQPSHLEQARLAAAPGGQRLRDHASSRTAGNPKEPRRRPDGLFATRSALANPAIEQSGHDVVRLARGGSWQLSSGPTTVAPPEYPERGVWVDRPTWSASVDGQALDLTYLEFELLDFLVRHPALVHSRSALLRAVWGYDIGEDSRAAGRTVDVHITRLRRKLGPEHRDRIETIRRVGYRYRPTSVARYP